MAERTLLEIRGADLKFLGICTVELGLGGCAIIMGGIFGPDPRSAIPVLYDFRQIISGVGMGAFAGIGLAIVMSLAQWIPWSKIQEFNDHTIPQLIGLLQGLSIPQIIVVALSAGVGEELLFRGWVMQGMTGEISSCSMETAAWSIGISSLVFGFAHPMNWLYIVLAALMGCVFGGLYWYFNNLLVPIAAHWVYDALMMIWLLRANREL